jgi:tungstate transport system ATP-binding protein
VVAPILPLRAENIRVARGGKTLLGPLSLEITGEGVTIVLGPNGSGKTTLLRALHGLERLREGAVRWAVPEPETRSQQAFVFQAPILMRRSVVDSIAYPLLLDGLRNDEARDRAADAAEAVGLGDRLALQAMDLSGGEKQKLAIARALVRRPQILFLDEPCANLDGRATRDIEAILAKVREQGTRIVMSTHKVGQARRMADEAVFLFDGRMIDGGKASDFFDNPQTPEARAHLQGDLLP